MSRSPYFSFGQKRSADFLQISVRFPFVPRIPLPKRVKENGEPVPLALERAFLLCVFGMQAIEQGSDLWTRHNHHNTHLSFDAIPQYQTFLYEALRISVNSPKSRWQVGFRPRYVEILVCFDMPSAMTKNTTPSGSREPTIRLVIQTFSCRHQNLTPLPHVHSHAAEDPDRGALQPAMVRIASCKTKACLGVVWEHVVYN